MTTCLISPSLPPAGGVAASARPTLGGRAIDAAPRAVAAAPAPRSRRRVNPVCCACSGFDSMGRGFLTLDLRSLAHHHDRARGQENKCGLKERRTPAEEYARLLAARPGLRPGRNRVPPGRSPCDR